MMATSQTPRPESLCDKSRNQLSIEDGADHLPVNKTGDQIEQITELNSATWRPLTHNALRPGSRVSCQNSAKPTGMAIQWRNR